MTAVTAVTALAARQRKPSDAAAPAVGDDVAKLESFEASLAEDQVQKLAAPADTSDGMDLESLQPQAWT